MIPAGTELCCTHCSEVLTKIIKDLPDHEEVRNIWEYMENGDVEVSQRMNMRIPYRFEMVCENCKKGSNLHALIMEKFNAGSI